MHLRVKVVPGAKRERIEEGRGALKIFVKEPAQDNMANRRVIALVAERLQMPRSHVRLVAGHHAPNKTLEIKE